MYSGCNGNVIICTIGNCNYNSFICLIYVVKRKIFAPDPYVTCSESESVLYYRVCGPLAYRVKLGTHWSECENSMEYCFLWTIFRFNVLGTYHIFLIIRYTSTIKEWCQSVKSHSHINDKGRKSWQDRLRCPCYFCLVSDS